MKITFKKLYYYNPSMLKTSVFLIKESRENAFLHLGFYHRYKLFFKDSSKNFTGSLMFSRVLFEVFLRVNLDFHGKKIDNSSLVEYVSPVTGTFFLLFFHTE